VKEGREEEAIEDINKLIALDPNNASFYYVLGNIYSNEEKSVYDVDKTIENYTRALEINPDYYDAVYNLGVFYTSLANKRIEEANNITGFSKAEIAQYDALIEQANDLLRTGLPYLQQAYQTQPSDDVKSVLKSIYVKLNMTDELKALEEQ
jgi:tetratricopeptide (TPR) repeat protein